MKTVRKPIVAGQFYTSNEKLLKKELAGYTAEKTQQIDAMGVVSPHAGYMYSGAVAGRVLSSIKPSPTYVILGPNHTGVGKPFGVDMDRAWVTPLGEMEIDAHLGNELIQRSKYLERDSLCHNHEHSIEVQLPFLQVLNTHFTIVPIVISSAGGDAYKNIGKEIARAIKDLKKDAVIIASSDMTHYESHESAKKKDKMAIDKILSLDVDGFLETVEKNNISMCGFAPTAIMMQACIDLGSKSTKLVHYNTSGDASGDYDAVVGYAGIVIY